MSKKIAAPANRGAAGRKPPGRKRVLNPDLVVTVTDLGGVTELPNNDESRLDFALSGGDLIVDGTVEELVKGKKVKCTSSVELTGVIFAKQFPRDSTKRVVSPPHTTSNGAWQLIFDFNDLSNAGLLSEDAMLVVHAQSSTDKGRGVSGPFRADP